MPLSRVLFLVLLVGCRAERPAPPAGGATDSAAWSADHHMHVASADLCARVGECFEAHTPAAVYAADAIAMLDSSHIARGVLLSCAYLYGLPSLELSETEVARWTRIENEFTAAEVARDSARLVGFLSVNPLQPSAIEELDHWRGSTLLVGLKIHFTASGVDLRQADHRAKLTQVLRHAADQGLPLAIHIAGGAFDTAGARLFLDSVLPATHPSVVQIAHGAGGLPLAGNNHVEILRLFANRVARGDSLTSRLLFDLSYVPAPEEDDSTVADLVREMRRIGMNRFLFGSDFDVLTPAAQIAALHRLGLSPAELTTIRTTCAPWAC